MMSCAFFCWCHYMAWFDFDSNQQSRQVHEIFILVCLLDLDEIDFPDFCCDMIITGHFSMYSMFYDG